MPKHGPLPPLPETPRRRNLTPPARRQSGTFGVDSEAETPARNPTAAHFAALASVFDELTNAEREELTELAFTFRELREPQRKAISRIARGLLDKQNQR
jgi:hypothetical protein